MVEPDQQEPNLPAEGQPHRHDLVLSLFNSTLDLQYAFNPRLAVAVQLPFRAIFVDAEFTDEAGQALEIDSIHHRTETVSGLADPSLEGVVGFSGAGWWLTARTGFSVPLGSTEPDPFELGHRGKEHQHLFLGTGTFDPRATLSLGLPFDSWSLGARVHATGALYENDHGYKSGWKLTSGLRADTGLGLQHWRFGVQFDVFREWPAAWSGRTAENSGRLDILPGLGAQWLPSPKWAVHVEVQRPITLMVEGGQVEPSFFFSFGLSHHFDLAN